MLDGCLASAARRGDWEWLDRCSPSNALMETVPNVRIYQESAETRSQDAVCFIYWPKQTHKPWLRRETKAGKSLTWTNKCLFVPTHWRWLNYQTPPFFLWRRRSGNKLGLNIFPGPCGLSYYHAWVKVGSCQREEKACLRKEMSQAVLDVKSCI